MYGNLEENHDQLNLPNVWVVCIRAFQTKLQRILYVVHPGFGQNMPVYICFIFILFMIFN